MQCGVLSCGRTDDGLPVNEFGLLNKPATWRGRNPASGLRFLCCDQCKAGFAAVEYYENEKTGVRFRVLEWQLLRKGE